MINFEDLILGKNLTRHDVTYHVYKSNDFEPKEKGDAIINQCFSGVMNYIKTTNRLLYKVRRLLSTEENVEWVKTCKEYKLVPETICKEGKENELNFVFDTTISKSLLYFYISNIRLLEEEPEIIKVVLFLKKYNVNVYAAFYMASKYFVRNSNHTYINPPAGYYGRGGKVFDLSKMKIGLNEAKSFLEFLNNHEKYMSQSFICRPIFDSAVKPEKISDWGMEKFNCEEFSRPDLNKIIYSQNVEEIKEVVNKVVKDRVVVVSNPEPNVFKPVGISGIKQKDLQEVKK